MDNMIAVKRIGLGWVAAIATLATGCTAQNTAEQPMTQATCEAHSGFVFVPGGEFVAGSDRTERDYAYRITAEGFAESAATVADAEAGYRKQGWFDREPERQILNLHPFCMSDHRVTNVDYQVFVRATGHPAPGISEADYQAQGFLVHSYAEVVPYLWQGDQYPTGQGQHPVVLVSYEEAVAYADWRAKRDGVRYRLPTKWEWEKAARGTDGRYFPWGNEWRKEATHWAKSGANTNGVRGTSAIATYPASRSPYGIEDMAGNVFEYTSTFTDKPDPEVILKGCGWDDYPGFCRAAYEHDRPVNSKHILFGFRLVLE